VILGDFRYAPLIDPDILSGVLTNVSGKSVLELATEWLFSPLEIDAKSNVIFKDKEEHFAFLKLKILTIGFLTQKEETQRVGGLP
jgi:hypothetical protein